VKLLFDHHLSQKLVKRLADIFPDSSQTGLLGMGTVDDLTLWNYARQHGFSIVSLDADFCDLSVLHGHPPKLVWLRCGNSTVRQVEGLLRLNHERIEAFGADPAAGCLEIL
jgi:predicted nuclease of predicted toxin-antitoxin system